MPNFGVRWQIVETKRIGKGGQSHAYLVRDSEGNMEDRYVAKVLYSLGKLLYWLFTGRVYDREEQDYGTTERKLAAVLDQSVPAYSFVDQLVGATVRYDPNDRKIPGAKNFAASCARQSSGSSPEATSSICAFRSVAFSADWEPIVKHTRRIHLRDLLSRAA
jgi:hypothetical protein